jgi:uncharacterized protein YjbI with pentapeptide repeats
MKFSRITNIINSTSAKALSKEDLKKLLLWLCWDFTGFRFIWSKILPPSPKQEQDKRRASSFVFWFIGIYAAFFGIATQRYENTIDKIENRANAVLAQLSGNPKIVMERIAEVQNMRCPVKPEFFTPFSFSDSLQSETEYKEPYSEIVNLLKFTIEDWIRKTRKEKFKYIFEGINLSKAHLEEIKLKKTYLENVDFYMSYIGKADFDSTYLANANFYKTQIEKTIFTNAELTDAYFDGANAKNAVFKDAKLENASFLEANLRSANFQDANLENVDFSKGNLKDATFLRSKLENACLWEADLENAYFKQANLKGAVLCKANFQNVQDLTIEQLSEVKCMYGVRNLDPELIKQIQEKYPYILESNKNIWGCYDN